MKLVKYLFLMSLLIASIMLLNLDMKKEDPKAITLAFYNVENLFDTINDPDSNDDEYLPQSKLAWTKERYVHKINNLAKVIDRLGDSDGPEIIGLSEVENRQVLKDLIHSEFLKKKGYGIIQFESPDRRGIDVALLYKKNRFKPYATISKSIELPGNKSFRTRAILLVSGTIGKDTIHFLVNHWPSRLGGKEKSEAKRMLAASTAKALSDSLFALSKNFAVVIMGDFNDEPFNKSIRKILGVKDKADLCALNDYYNPFYRIREEGAGTYKYKGAWELFDQIFISGKLLKKNTLQYEIDSEDIYDPIWMYYKEDMNHGPFRTYVGTRYYGGYSDHFPVYVQLRVGNE